MRFRIILVFILLFVIASQVFALEEMKLKNMFVSRTISGTVNIFKTSKLEVNGEQILDEPSIEFMIDIESNGKSSTLLPGDFHVMRESNSEQNKIITTTVELYSRDDSFPLMVFVHYYREQKSPYMQKSITIYPCKKPTGVTIKRVTLEYMRLKNMYMPVVPQDRYVLESEDDAKTVAPDTKNLFSFDGYSNFAAIDPKTSKGIFFLTEPQRAKVIFTPRHFLTITEEANVPLEKGYETAKTTIGVASGSPETIYKQYREYLLNSRCSVMQKTKNMEAFKKKFDTYFQACQYVSIPKENNNIDAEAHVVGDKGFIILFNSSDKPQKMQLPLDEPNLALKEEVKLSDWSNLDSSSDMQSAGVNDKVDIEIGPGSMKIIGINI